MLLTTKREWNVVLSARKNRNAEPVSVAPFLHLPVSHAAKYRRFICHTNYIIKNLGILLISEQSLLRLMNMIFIILNFVVEEARYDARILKDSPLCNLACCAHFNSQIASDSIGKRLGISK